MDANLIGLTFHPRLLAISEVGYALSFDQADRFFIDQTLSYIWQNPAEAARNFSNKALKFFHYFEYVDVYFFFTLRRVSSFLKYNPLGFGFFVCFLGLGLVGLFQRKRYESLLFLFIFLAVFGSNVLFYTTWKLRLPALLPLLIFAVAGIVYCFECTERLLRRSLSAHRAVWLFLLPLFLSLWLAHRSASDREVFAVGINLFENERKTKEKVKNEKWLRLRRGDLKGEEQDMQVVKHLWSLARYTQAYQRMQTLRPCSKGMAMAEVCGYEIRFLLWLWDSEALEHRVSILKRGSADYYASVTKVLHATELYVLEEMFFSENDLRHLKGEYL